MNYSASIMIQRPIEDVFDLTLHHVAEWSNIVVEDEVIEDVSNGDIGTRFRTTTVDRGREMIFEGIVTEHEPPTLSSIEMRGGVRLTIIATYEFSRVDGGTQVTQHTSVSGKGIIFNLFFLLFGWLARKSSCDAAYNELQSLREFCENYDEA